MLGSGTLLVYSAGTLRVIHSVPTRRSSDLTLANAGTVTWANTATAGWFAQNAAQINNQTGGVFGTENNLTHAHKGSEAPWRTTAGTLQKSAGSGTSIIGIALNNNTGCSAKG